MASAYDRQFLTELNEEWQQRYGSDQMILAGWSARWSCFTGAVDLDDLLAGRRRDDAVLAALLRLDRDGDPDAGRVILQAVLPAIVRMAGRDAHAELADYVSQLWCRIRTYPLERRPTKIANNLELDTLKSVCQERPRSPLTPTEPDELDDILTSRQRLPHDDRPDVPRVLSLAVAHGWIDDYTKTVLHTVYADGLSGRDAAERHNTSVDLIRWRCSRAVKTLARHATVLAECA